MNPIHSAASLRNASATPVFAVISKSSGIMLASDHCREREGRVEVSAFLIRNNALLNTYTKEVSGRSAGARAVLQEPTRAFPDGKIARLRMDSTLSGASWSCLSLVGLSSSRARQLSRGKSFPSLFLRWLASSDECSRMFEENVGELRSRNKKLRIEPLKIVTCPKEIPAT